MFECTSVKYLQCSNPIGANKLPKLFIKQVILLGSNVSTPLSCVCAIFSQKLNHTGCFLLRRKNGESFMVNNFFSSDFIQARLPDFCFL